jgi:hypothetical protein
MIASRVVKVLTKRVTAWFIVSPVGGPCAMADRWIGFVANTCRPSTITTSGSAICSCEEQLGMGPSEYIRLRAHPAGGPRVRFP